MQGNIYFCNVVMLKMTVAVVSTDYFPTPLFPGNEILLFSIYIILSSTSNLDIIKNMAKIFYSNNNNTLFYIAQFNISVI